jgi:oligopeptide transport system permease protein
MQSYFARGGLSPLLLNEAWITVRLGFLAVVIMLVLGVWLGVVSATRHGTMTDHLARFASSVGYGVPNFVWAMWLFYFFTPVLYRWTGGALYVPVGWGEPAQWIPPAIALALPQAGLVARVVRASMLDVLGEDYVRTAWAKGLEERAVVTRHALRNSLIPLTTVMGPIAVATLMGSIVVENAFSVPGLGPELVQGIFSRAYFTVTGVFTYYSLLAGLAMLLVDVAYRFIDPRIRY